MNSLAKKLLKCLLWTFLLLIFFSTSISAMPGHRAVRRKIRPKGENTDIIPSPHKHLKILFYPQTLDHFNYQPESYTIFKHKYMLYSKHWGGGKAKSPILVYFGDESPMYADDIDYLIYPDYVVHFKALLVMIEHRFYGDSTPFGMSMEEVMKNASVRGYFNSAQALADHAELILHLKESLNAHYSPVIVAGGSYGGMLASWFRLKYPHIALGALAASAPVLYFDNIISPNHGYYSIVNKDFRETSKSCYETIRKSWGQIDKIGKKPNGLSFLNRKFNMCAPLNNTGELKHFLEILYDSRAQYSNPAEICHAIDRGSHGTDILSRIYAGVIAIFGDDDCIDTNYWDIGDSNVGYAWQNMKLVLQRFGSNIIFSNGLRDPYSSAGVLENLSDSIIAVYTTNGSHCEDTTSASDDDPEWLVQQRKREVEIIDGWIRKYYEDLENYMKYNHW